MRLTPFVTTIGILTAIGACGCNGSSGGASGGTAQSQQPSSSKAAPPAIKSSQAKTPTTSNLSAPLAQPHPAPYYFDQDGFLRMSADNRLGVAYPFGNSVYLTETSGTPEIVCPTGMHFASARDFALVGQKSGAVITEIADFSGYATPNYPLGSEIVNSFQDNIHDEFFYSAGTYQSSSDVMAHNFWTSSWDASSWKNGSSRKYVFNGRSGILRTESTLDGTNLFYVRCFPGEELNPFPIGNGMPIPPPPRPKQIPSLGTPKTIETLDRNGGKLAKFTQVQFEGGFGFGWQDPTGAVWSTVIGQFQNSPVKSDAANGTIVESSATSACANIGASLPNADEYKRLMGYFDNFGNYPTDKGQMDFLTIFPDEVSKDSRGLSQGFWTSTALDPLSGIYSSWGATGIGMNRYEIKAVRCILR